MCVCGWVGCLSPRLQGFSDLRLASFVRPRQLVMCSPFQRIHQKRVLCCLSASALSCFSLPCSYHPRRIQKMPFRSVQLCVCECVSA